MKELFEFVRDNILHGMPSGCLVTRRPVEFDIGMWQHKAYNTNDAVYDHLRGIWTPHTINLIIFDEEAKDEDVKTFVGANAFEKNERNIYLVYCMAIKTSLVTNDLADFLKKQTFPFNAYTNKVPFNDYSIFVCDFVKNLLLY